MPKQGEFETSSTREHDWWRALHEQARLAGLPALPSFTELPGQSRALLFRELGYTFWNRELVDALASRMRAEGCERWVELAAGTGRLAAELVRRGVGIVATDNYSQAAEAVRGSQRSIRYGSWVAHLSARDALVELAPDGVLCAWPPLGSCLVPDLLVGVLPGAERLRIVLAIGDPQGATEAPVHPHELPAGWSLEAWPNCARWLLGFNDSEDARDSHSRLLVYRKQPVDASRGEGK